MQKSNRWKNRFLVGFKKHELMQIYDPNIDSNILKATDKHNFKVLVLSSMHYTPVVSYNKQFYESQVWEVTGVDTR